MLNLVLSLGYDDVELVLDPTLLLSKSTWDQLIPSERPIEEPYCLYYTLQKNAFDEAEIRKFASERNIKFVTLYGSASQMDTDEKRTTDGPQEFVNLIRYADFVFTSSYHGMVFSLIYNRNFFASFSHNSERAASLLNTLGLNDYLLAPKAKIPVYNPYESFCLKKLEPLRQVSFKYLESKLQKDEP